MVHLTDSGHAPGTIVVAAAMQPRYYEFTTSMEALGAPVGSKYLIVRSCDITQNFNDGIKKMVGEWVWFLGDDHSFDKKMLLNLLNYNVDVVVPITPCKSLPFMPCVMHGPEDPNVVWHEDMPVYHWDELSGEGLFPLPFGDYVGQAGMLVRKPVLDKLGYPWFKCGQLDPGRLQEDLNFCRRVQEAGYTVYIDQNQILNHHSNMGITARKTADGCWSPAVEVGIHTMVLPGAKPQALENPYYKGQGKVKWANLQEQEAAAR